MHLAREAFRSSHDDGKFIMPVTKYVTYCNRVVLGEEIADLNADCEECSMARAREEIDKLEERKQKALEMQEAGILPSYSTGIHGFITRGYGKLDDNGFWEFPLPDLNDTLNEPTD